MQQERSEKEETASMELNQTSIHYYDKRLARVSTCSETADAIVPDTFPDIGRIVCAYGTAAMRDQSPQSGRILTSGMIQVTVLYEPEQEGSLKRLTVPISFAHIEECEGIDAQSICVVGCQVASVDVTAVNSRKINVNAQLCFAVEAYCAEECEITEGIADYQIELLSAMQTVTLTEHVQTYPLTILDDVVLQDAEGLTILHSSCMLRTSECRTMRGKVVLKGEAEVQCLAMQEDDTVRMLTNTTPFTQILEMPEAEEGDTVCVQLTARETDCRIEQDELLSYTISASALFSLRRTRGLRQINDLYLPGRTMRMKEEKAMLHSMPPAIAFSADASDTLPTTRHVSHIISAHAACCAVKRSAGGDIQMTAAVHVLFLDAEQRMHALERMLPLSMPCAVSGRVSDVMLTVRASAAGETGIAVNITATGTACAEDRVAFRHITELEVGEPQPKQEQVSLLLRYIEQEQQLWEIAKECGTTMEAIRHANDLPADAASVGHTVLLIPILA